MNEYLNPWHILAETGTSRHVIMMHFGNGDVENTTSYQWPIVTLALSRTVSEIRWLIGWKSPHCTSLRHLMPSVSVENLYRSW